MLSPSVKRRCPTLEPRTGWHRQGERWNVHARCYEAGGCLGGCGQSLSSGSRFHFTSLTKLSGQKALQSRLAADGFFASAVPVVEGLNRIQVLGSSQRWLN